MSQREKNKEQNRDKIVAAARQIIKSEGIDKLTMRYLADKAEVSLRTPYNLFGSKTAVLLALFDEASFGISDAANVDDGLVLEHLLHFTDQLVVFAKKDETFYRDVFWAIMISGDHSDRAARIALQRQLIEAAITQAVRAGELNDTLDIATFSQHLSTIMASLLGMWGAGFFSSDATAAQIRYAWCNAFIVHATDRSRALLMQRQGDTLDILARHRDEGADTPGQTQSK